MKAIVIFIIITSTYFSLNIKHSQILNNKQKYSQVKYNEKIFEYQNYIKKILF